MAPSYILILQNDCNNQWKMVGEVLNPQSSDYMNWTHGQYPISDRHKWYITPFMQHYRTLSLSLLDNITLNKWSIFVYVRANSHMSSLWAVNCHGTAGGCLSVGSVSDRLRYSQSCFLCIVSTANYWLDGNCCKVQTVQSEQWPPNVQPQLQSTLQKLELEDWS